MTGENQSLGSVLARREALIRPFPILELLQDCEDPPLDKAAVEELEILLECRFPREYAEFLLAFNGGYFRRRVYFSLHQPEPFLTGGTVTGFYGESEEGIQNHGIVWWAKTLDDQISRDCLAIAHCGTGDSIVLRFGEEDRSSFQGIWFWDSEAIFNDEQPLHWLADTFHDFLAMLIYDVTAYESRPEELPLFQAIQDGNFSTIRRYVTEGGELEKRNAKGWTLLMAAAVYKWPRIVRLLLDHGADLHAQDRKGQTPLHHAAAHSIDCMKMFLEAGADPKARDNKGKSVLAGWSYRADQILKRHGAEE